jgi:hypothetical protein
MFTSILQVVRKELELLLSSLLTMPGTPFNNTTDMIGTAVLLKSEKIGTQVVALLWAATAEEVALAADMECAEALAVEEEALVVVAAMAGVTDEEALVVVEDTAAAAADMVVLVVWLRNKPHRTPSPTLRPQEANEARLSTCET